jgi:hypothetical protein
VLPYGGEVPSFLRLHRRFLLLSANIMRVKNRSASLTMENKPCENLKGGVTEAHS